MPFILNGFAYQKVIEASITYPLKMLMSELQGKKEAKREERNHAQRTLLHTRLQIESNWHFTQGRHLNVSQTCQGYQKDQTRRHHNFSQIRLESRH